MLFATLDTSIRRIHAEGNKDFLLSDTVGFIEDLPHTLIKAFRSTLEEAVYADLIVVVLDVSDPYYRQHKKVTEDKRGRDLDFGGEKQRSYRADGHDHPFRLCRKQNFIDPSAVSARRSFKPSAHARGYPVRRIPGRRRVHPGQLPCRYVGQNPDV